jgi:hypothetical protein
MAVADAKRGPAVPPPVLPPPVAPPPIPGGVAAPAEFPTDFLWSQLDDAEEDLEGKSWAEAVEAAFAAGGVAVLAASAGYLFLSGRGVYWLLTALTARPLFWKQFDPMDVLFAWEEAKERRRARGAADAREDEETLQSLIEAR